MTTQIEFGDPRHALLLRLESDSSLLQPERLRERLTALDELDGRFWGLECDSVPIDADSELRQRVEALQTRLEAVNAALYQSLRAEIIRGQSRPLSQWLEQPEIPLPGLGFDFRDELVSGVLQLREPGEPNLPWTPEMVRYLPTPVRHILHLITASALAEDDTFVDLGSGLGHVPLLVSMLTGAQCIGIEMQAAYVASARECAESLRLSRVRFTAQDVREADLSTGTIFYLYTPFNGSIMIEILSALRVESTRRPIEICTLGPCAQIVANEPWLKASSPPDVGHITVFESQ